MQVNEHLLPNSFSSEHQTAPFIGLNGNGSHLTSVISSRRICRYLILFM